MILVVCYDPAFGAADNICRAFNSQGVDSRLLYKKKDPYGRTDIDNLGDAIDFSNIKYWFEILEQKDNRVIFTGLTSSKMFLGHNKKATKYLRSSVVIGETNYRQAPKQGNKLLDELNIEHRFCSFDLLHLGEKNVPFLYPMQYDNIDKTKNERMTVCFSPGMGRREERKGTLAVEKGVDLAKKEIDFDFDFVMKLPHQECLKRKAKAHIFIDQINLEVGGIGKSGLEAAALDCVTLCSINKFDKSFREYLPHPIINVENSEQLAEQLVNLMRNPDKLSSMQKKTKEWKHSFNYENTVSYMRNIWNQ